MEERYLEGLTLILVLGVAARWVAWRLHLPSILLLLVAGIVAGPILGYLHPDELFGDLLFPFVSICVSLILFEGGLNLNLRELREIGGVVRNLITLGALITWALGAGAAYLFLDFSWPLALLLGGIFVVTGPTVILPLLRYVRPTVRIRNTIKWEGILNDPIGAILAVLIFEAILAGGGARGAPAAALQFLYAVLAGALVGLAAAVLLLVLIYFHWVPEALDNALSLAMVVSAYTVSNSLQPESGLLAVTLMGIALANQRLIPLRHIVEFKENLRVLILSLLFILLAARLEARALAQVWLPSLLFLAALVLIVRPVAVWASTLRSKLSRQEKLFLAWMAPRGIVAAAVSSIFANRLIEAGIEGAERLVPVAFLVIIGTIVIYGLTAFPVARWLKLAEPSPQGVLFVGAHSWAREMARVLKKEGFQTALADSRWNHVSAARLEGLQAHYGVVLSERVLDEINPYGIGRLFAVTSNEEANSLAAVHFADVFGRSEVYQLPPAQPREPGSRRSIFPPHLQGRHLFASDATFERLSRLFEEGSVIKSTLLTEKFNFDSFRDMYGPDALPLFVIQKNKNLLIWTAKQPLKPRPGQTLISVVPPERGGEAGAAQQASQTASGVREKLPE